MDASGAGGAGNGPVAVVGAGISGLLAARELTAAGREVHVFEKSRGPGGRLSTRRQAGHAFDHGAQYFTVRDPLFRREVDAWLRTGAAARWDARLVEARGGDVHVHESEHERYVGTPGMSAITRHLARELDVRREVRISSITRDDGAWRLRSGPQDRGRYETVLVTTPPEQAAPLLEGAPVLADVARQVRSSPCWAVLASFEAPLDAAFDGAFVEDERLAWAARNDSKPDRPPQPSWVLHATSAWSRAHAEASPEAVTAALLAAFFETTGVAPQSPTFTSVQRWLLAQTTSPLAVGALWDAGLGLGACGDWLHGCRVEGAALSGLDLARRVLGSS